MLMQPPWDQSRSVRREDTKSVTCLQEGDQLAQLLGAPAHQVHDVQAAGRALAALCCRGAVDGCRTAVNSAAAVLQAPLQHRDIDAHRVPQPGARQSAHRLRLRRREQACTATSGIVNIMVNDRMMVCYWFAERPAGALTSSRLRGGASCRLHIPAASSQPAEQLAVGTLKLYAAARTGAALAGQAGHDRVQLLPEAHVQQPVRLVQHQHLRVVL
jgi:hypothetical protein